MGWLDALLDRHQEAPGLIDALGPEVIPDDEEGAKLNREEDKTCRQGDDEGGDGRALPALSRTYISIDCFVQDAPDGGHGGRFGVVLSHGGSGRGITTERDCMIATERLCI